MRQNDAQSNPLTEIMGQNDAQTKLPMSRQWQNKGQKLFLTRKME